MNLSHIETRASSALIMGNGPRFAPAIGCFFSQPLPGIGPRRRSGLFCARSSWPKVFDVIPSDIHHPNGRFVEGRNGTAAPLRGIVQ